MKALAKQNLIIIVALTVLGVLGRWLPHPPNFTPVIAIALYSGLRLRPRSLAIVVPFAIMILSDLMLGFHSIAFFTYPVLILLAVMGTGKVQNSIKFFDVASFSVLGAVLFFLVSNLGVWVMTEMYTHTAQGLMACYVAGLPFFQSTLVSTLIFGIVFYAVDKMALRALSSAKAG